MVGRPVPIEPAEGRRVVTLLRWLLLGYVVIKACMLLPWMAALVVIALAYVLIA